MLKNGTTYLTALFFSSYSNILVTRNMKLSSLIIVIYIHFIDNVCKHISMLLFLNKGQSVVNDAYSELRITSVDRSLQNVLV